MIYVQLRGGLGNQMFQYAYGRARALELGTDLALDTFSYTRQSGDDTPRAYELHHYPIQATLASFSDVARYYTRPLIFWRKIKNRILPDSTYTFQTRECLVKDGSWLQGYWQSEKYFSSIRPTLIKEFTLQIPLSSKANHWKEHIQNAIFKGTALSVHVRRGDYVTLASASSHHGALHLSYYSKAFETFYSTHTKLSPNKQVTVYLFGDDATWLQNDFLPLVSQYFGKTVHIISDGKLTNVEELYLQTLCTHHIIANSSFSWWGAWLSTQDGVTIAPQQWLKNPSINTKDICPESWMRV
jgi:hypothetical protein